MGDATANKKMDAAMHKRDAFRSNKKLAQQVDDALVNSKGTIRKRLLHWKNFFSLFQTPDAALPIKKEVAELESEIHKIRTTRKEGYFDPYTNEFTVASENKMSSMLSTNPDEKIRKAIFDALQKLPHDTVHLFAKLISKRNEFARVLGYENFYAYKAKIDENMTLTELFSVFEKIYDKTHYVYDEIRALENKTPGITKPWNFSYMMTGDFTKEEDPYFNINEALTRWGATFSALGADLAGGTLVLDLLDRKGKYNNGFCHWPKTVSYVKNKRIAGTSQISCNIVLGQVGEGYSEGHVTLFHEGGHAVHYLNSVQKDVILNHEYPPSSVSWAETQSGFMDTILSSIEWSTRYANYPFELFEKKKRQLHFLAPLSVLSINSVMELERRLYEEKNISPESIIKIAYEVNRKFSGLSETTLSLLNVPHIYSWESSAYYHGYGLAKLQVCQLRDYFYKKYGYIVDNPNIGKELKKVWKLAASRPSNEFIKMITGKKISADAYIKTVTAPIEQVLKDAKEKIKRLEKVKRYTKPIDLKGTVVIVDGKRKIADSKKGFEIMAEKFKKWLNIQK